MSANAFFSSVIINILPLRSHMCMGSDNWAIIIYALYVAYIHTFTHIRTCVCMHVHMYIYT